MSTFKKKTIIILARFFSMNIFTTRSLTGLGIGIIYLINQELLVILTIGIFLAKAMRTPLPPFHPVFVLGRRVFGKF